MPAKAPPVMFITVIIIVDIIIIITITIDIITIIIIIITISFITITILLLLIIVMPAKADAAEAGGQQDSEIDDWEPPKDRAFLRGRGLVDVSFCTSAHAMFAPSSRRQLSKSALWGRC